MGCANVQLKIKTVKSIGNRYLSVFSCSLNRFEIHFISIKFCKTALKFFQVFSPCFLVRESVPCDCSSKAYGVSDKICFWYWKNDVLISSAA